MGYSSVNFWNFHSSAFVYIRKKLVFVKMGRKGKELTQKKQVVVELYQQGEKITNIAEILKIPRTTTSYVIKKFQERGSTENSKRSGRPCLIQGRSYRQLERLVKNDRRAPLGEITAKFNEIRDRKVCAKTVRRKLKEHRLRRGVYRKRVVVKTVNRKKRVSWCRGKRWQTVNNFWKNIIFSDESQVYIGEDQRIYIWRKPEEGWRPDLVKRREQCPVKVMIWGCICYSGVGTLAKVDGNINAENTLAFSRTTYGL